MNSRGLLVAALLALVARDDIARGLVALDRSTSAAFARVVAAWSEAARAHGPAPFVPRYDAPGGDASQRTRKRVPAPRPLSQSMRPLST